MSGFLTATGLSTDLALTNGTIGAWDALYAGVRRDVPQRAMYVSAEVKGTYLDGTPIDVAALEWVIEDPEIKLYGIPAHRLGTWEYPIGQGYIWCTGGSGLFQVTCTVPELKIAYRRLYLMLLADASDMEVRAATPEEIAKLTRP